MALTPSQKLLGRIAAILGILQGAAWIAMSLASIIIYQSEHKLTEPKDGSSYMAYLEYHIHYSYLYKIPQKEVVPGDDRSIKAKDFAIIMWFYFFFSVALATASVDLFFSIHRNKERQCNLMVLWGLITGGTSIIDLVITSLLLRDYGNCPSITTITDPLPSVACHTYVGVVMTLAARGFMLWIVNVFLTYTMITYGIQIITHKRVNNAIQDISIPRAKVPTPASTPNHWSSGLPGGQFPSFQNPPSQSSTFQNGHNQSSLFQNPSNQSGMFQNSPNEYPSFIKSGRSNFNY